MIDKKVLEEKYAAMEKYIKDTPMPLYSDMMEFFVGEVKWHLKH